MSFYKLLEYVKSAYNKTADFIIKFFKTILPVFLKNNFELVSTRKTKITASIITAVLETVVLVSLNSFTSLEFGLKWLLLVVALICPQAGIPKDNFLSIKD